MSLEPTYSLYLLNEAGVAVRVGPRGRTYEECREHAAPLVAALKHRDLVGYTRVKIIPDVDHRYFRTPVLEGSLLPGDRFSTLGGAGRAVAAHFGLPVHFGGLLALDGKHWTYEALGMRLWRAGVVGPHPEGGYRLERMPKALDVRDFATGKPQPRRRRWVSWQEVVDRGTKTP